MCSASVDASVFCSVIEMSKLSFRARALDATKPMPVFLAEELPDLPDYSAINRAVPLMPSGMEKEEECVSVLSCATAAITGCRATLAYIILKLYSTISVT